MTPGRSLPLALDFYSCTAIVAEENPSLVLAHRPGFGVYGQYSDEELAISVRVNPPQLPSEPPVTQPPGA